MLELRRAPWFLCATILVCSKPAHSQDRDYARSMVISRQGIVATSQTLASQAGAQILARGGSAIDAAIAANAVLGVVEPMSDGIGGDLFAIYWDAKTGKLSGINASGWAPKAQSIEYLRKKGISSMPQSGIQSVTVPGCVDGWDKLHRKFGRLPWRDLFRPAGRDDGGGGSERVRVGMGRADLDRLPRMESLRTAAERAGHGDARNVEHHGGVSAGGGRGNEHGHLPHQDGSAEAGVCGFA